MAGSDAPPFGDFASLSVTKSPNLRTGRGGGAAGTGNDLRRAHPQLWRAPDAPERITAPPVACLAVDGVGEPGGEAYSAAVGTLFAVSYGLRFAVKAAGGEPWAVMPLEGLWWADDMADYVTGDRARWRWTMLVTQPPVVTAAMVADAVAAATRKGKAPAGERLRLEVLDEGDAVQVMHHGPFATEGPTVAALHAWIAGAGLSLAGKHHEVYLSDPNRVAPERMRTIIRQPVSVPVSVSVPTPPPT